MIVWLLVVGLCYCVVVGLVGLVWSSDVCWFVDLIGICSVCDLYVI